MNTNQSLKKAQLLIEQDFLDEAIGLIKQHFGSGPFRKEIIVITNNLANLKKEIIAGSIASSEARMVRNQLTNRILELMQGIATSEPSDENQVEKSSEESPKIIINESKNINTGTIIAHGGDVHIGDSN